MEAVALLVVVAVVVEIKVANISLLVYGSLINKDELLNNDIEILDYTPVFVKGFKREFSQEPSWRKSTSQNRAVLNVREDANHFINALLINIYKENITILDKREIGYKRLKVDSNCIEFKYGLKKHIRQNDIFIYVGKDEKYNNLILPNLEYMDICIQGATTWGKFFYDDFIKSTFIQDEALESFIK